MVPYSKDVSLEGDNYQQYHFNGINEELKSPKPPCNGDYHLKLGSQEYDIENIILLSPRENSFEGFLFPQSEIEFTEQGYQQHTFEDVKLRVGE